MLLTSPVMGAARTVAGGLRGAVAGRGLAIANLSAVPQTEEKSPQSLLFQRFLPLPGGSQESGKELNFSMLKGILPGLPPCT